MRETWRAWPLPFAEVAHKEDQQLKQEVRTSTMHSIDSRAL